MQALALLQALRARLDAAAAALRVPPPYMYLAAAFAVLLALAMLLGLLARAGRPTPQPAPVAVVQSAPARPAPAAITTIALPALPAPAASMVPGADVAVYTAPKNAAAALVGRYTLDTATASVAADSGSLAGFLPPQPVRLDYTAWWHSADAAPAVLFVRVAGQQPAQVIACLDGRADPVAVVDHQASIWTTAAPTVAATSPLLLAQGWHAVRVQVDLPAPPTQGAADTVDLYIRPAGAAAPSALSWQRPATVASAPAQGASHAP